MGDYGVKDMMGPTTIEELIEKYQNDPYYSKGAVWT